MNRSFRNLIILSLTVAMTLGQTVLAAADEISGPESGPGYSNSGQTAPESSTGPSSGPGGGSAQDHREDTGPSSGPGSSTQEHQESSGSTGPGGGSAPGSVSPGGSGLPETAAATGQPASTSAFLAESMPDVQQTLNSHYLSMTLMNWDGGWSMGASATAGNTINIAFPDGILSLIMYSVGLPGDILYRTYTSATGWGRWVMNGEVAPYTGGNYIEAIQVRLNGVAEKAYDVSYSCTLSDGTTCGWSYNGRTNGAMGTGARITSISLHLSRKGVNDTSGTRGLVSCASSYDGIRFGDGLPTYVNGTGGSYTGWGWNGNDRYYFVDNSAVTGWQYIDGYKYYFDETGKLVTDLEPLIGSAGPFLLRINKQMNCTTVYAPDGANGYIIPVKSFLCSTGDDTPLGSFRCPEKYRWHEMVHGVYCQYLLRLGPGLHILLHSDLFDAPNNATLSPETYNYMGIANSAGCIRFVTAEARWLYEHCPVGTTIEVYNSPVPGPYERPCVEYFISDQQTWDPTDIDAVAVYGTLLGAN